MERPLEVPETAALAVAFLAPLVLVPLLVRFAIGRDLLDVPNARSSHEIPTPRLGGLAVIPGVWAAAIFLQGSWTLVLAATLAGAVGALDDFVNLKFWVKALGQAAVALGLLLALPPPLVEAAGPLGIAVLLFCVLWVVAVVNAYNFMDGIDGIAGGTVIINAVFLAALAGGVLGASFAVLATATAGFLAWNLSPARIFLGDSGSHFLGFFVGAGVLYTVPGSNVYLGFLIGAAVLTPFLFDTAYTLVRRARAGKNVFAAHREHIYQRVTPDPGMHRQVSIVYFGLSAFCGLAALIASMSALGIALAAGMSALCCLFMASLPRLAERLYYDGR